MSERLLRYPLSADFVRHAIREYRSMKCCRQGHFVVARRVIRRYRVFFPVFLAPLLLSGCSLLHLGHSLLDRESRAIYVVTLHQFVHPEQETGRSLRYVTDFSGARQLAVKRIPLIDSKSFTAGVPLAADAEHKQGGIRFHLDQHGTTLWIQTYKAMSGRHAAVLVDGFYCFSIRIPGVVRNPAILDIRGPWSGKEAANIAAQAEKNYKLLNGKGQLRFPW
jgi:hypothetical protein